MIDAGFDYGTPIVIACHKTTRSVFGDVIPSAIVITPSAEPTKRKVSRVMNHGKALPVLDLRGDVIAHLGNIGDTVGVVITKNKITITGANA